MISLKLLAPAQLSIHQYIQMLGCPQFATLEILNCETAENWSHLLFDAILHQWKHLKNLRVRHGIGPISDIGNDPDVVSQLMTFIPIDPASLITKDNGVDDNKSSTSSSLSTSRQYGVSSSSSIGEGKRWIHQSFERLHIDDEHHIQHWIMPSLHHFTTTTHRDRKSHVQFDEVELIWSFLSQSYERLHTLQLIPYEPNIASRIDKFDNGRLHAQLKRITFPNLERLIISNSYLKWLYECIDAGPFLSFIQINDLSLQTCERLIDSKKPMINLTISPLTHPNEWHHYQPIHLYLRDPSTDAISNKHCHTLLSQFTNIKTLQIRKRENDIDCQGIEHVVRSFLPIRSIHLLFAEL
jgi:hypothetical protein